MSNVQLLSLIGQISGVVSAFLMYYFPPAKVTYTLDGDREVPWTTGTKSEENKIKAKWHIRLSKAAPVLLGLSFILQMISMFNQPN